MHHSTFQILGVVGEGIEAGTGFFSADAQRFALERFPSLAKDAYYGLTNAHVVRGAGNNLYSRHVVCRRTDLPLSVVGVADEVDLAVVKLSGRAKRLLDTQLRCKANLGVVPMLTLADSDSVAMPAAYGDPTELTARVQAVGHPLGSEFQTQTVGAVEGWKRVNQGASQLFIAHTATIQQGNSGGPLLNASGNCVGINSLKATGQSVDGLQMAIPSRRILSYLPHMLMGEEQGALTQKLVRLASHLKTQGAEVQLLDALAQQHAPLGDARSMAASYTQAMACGGCCGKQSDAHAYPTLASFVRGFAHKPGFHALFHKVATHLLTANHTALHDMASRGFDTELCGHCQQSHVGAGMQSLYCQSPMPAALVHSPQLGFDYKATSALTRAALGVPHLKGGVVVSEVLPYGQLAHKLKPMDIITSVQTIEGVHALDEQGEHYKAAWGLSLGLSDLVDRAPLSTAVKYNVFRDGRPMEVAFTHAPLQAEQRPAVRHLDASEAHLDAAVSVAGVTFKVLRMSDLANPQMAQSCAMQYSAPSKRHLQKILVAGVDPQSAVFHNYSLMPGQVVSHVNRAAVPSQGAWQDFLGKLVEAGERGGLALVGTEGGGVDTFPVTGNEAAQLKQFMQHLSQL